MSDTSSGAGQQDPDDSNTDFQMIAFLVRQMTAQMATMKLVQVKAVHSNGAVSAAGTVDVLPLVNQVDASGYATPHGTVYGIPWYRMQGGKNAVILDPVVGDIGYVTIADRDSSNVKKTQAQANPGSSRLFDLADGIYVGGVLNGAPEQYIAFGDNGITIADKNGNVITMKSGSIAITGNLTVTGSITAGFGGADAVTVQLHEHTANNTPPTPGT